MDFFTSDEHYFHKNIIKYCNRPFKNVDEMNKEIIDRHNSVVGIHDTTYHAGDYTLIKDRRKIQEIINQLNGHHVFIKGSHDYWLNRNYRTKIEMTIKGQSLTINHYCMETWHKSHWNSWLLYGHSHGQWKTVGKKYDIGVDNNNFFPISFIEICNIMDKLPNNINFIEK